MKDLGQVSQFQGRNVNPGLPKYEEKVSATLLRRSVVQIMKLLFVHSLPLHFFNPLGLNFLLSVHKQAQSVLFPSCVLLDDR
jgi:hypothetical protein